MSSDTVATITPAASERSGLFGSFRSRRRNPASVVLAVILTSQLMVVLDATIVNVALPDIQDRAGLLRRAACRGCSTPTR